MKLIALMFTLLINVSPFFGIELTSDVVQGILYPGSTTQLLISVRNTGMEDVWILKQEFVLSRMVAVYNSNQMRLKGFTSSLVDNFEGLEEMSLFQLLQPGEEYKIVVFLSLKEVGNGSILHITNTGFSFPVSENVMLFHFKYFVNQYFIDIFNLLHPNEKLVSDSNELVVSVQFSKEKK